MILCKLTKNPREIEINRKYGLLVRGIVKMDFMPLKSYIHGVEDALKYIQTDEYRKLPKIQ